LVPDLVLLVGPKDHVHLFILINTSGTGKRIVYGKKTPQLGFTKVLIDGSSMDTPFVRIYYYMIISSLPHTAIHMLHFRFWTVTII
jgi:hypothetical protein